MNIKTPNSLIDRPNSRPDRLTTILSALRPMATVCASDAPGANLLITDEATAPGTPAQVSLVLTGVSPKPQRVLAAANITFRGSAQTMLASTGPTITVDLEEAPALNALTEVFISETTSPRCGGKAAMARLAEAMLALLLRNAIESFSSTMDAGGTGLLAGLSHPRLHLALVAMHEDPGADWTSERLADICGMSRSRFMASFRETMGESPGAYLASWRMILARDALVQNVPIKEVAHRLGYGSAAAFSRAFTRICGHPPSQVTLPH